MTSKEKIVNNYVEKIKNNIITIDDVPLLYRDDVEAQINETN